MEKRYCVYMMTNKYNSVIYTGFSGSLGKRVFEHKEQSHDGFTKRYKTTKLVYYEVFRDPYSALAREKQIKAGSRKKKIELIEKMNPTWKDLSEELFE
jgi:putative endonuclease